MSGWYKERLWLRSVRPENRKKREMGDSRCIIYMWNSTGIVIIATMAIIAISTLGCLLVPGSCGPLIPK